MKDLLALRKELLEFRVLDPACGSGNFLYIAYREMVRLEIRIMTRLDQEFSWRKVQKQAQSTSLVSPRQFYGLDRDYFGVELAKVTLMLAKKLALEEAAATLERDQIDLPLATDEALPFDNLDSNIRCADALFDEWPTAEAIVGNPPYQSKNKMQKELGRTYLNQVRSAFPQIDGRADYCVYWFRKAHDQLGDGKRAGLVGTNTVRQNYSRISGLDYIVDNKGVITEAVSTMKWSGDASVDVSIVNWVKGTEEGKKRLYVQSGSDPATGWRYEDFADINSSLSFGKDVSQAKAIRANAQSSACFQGQTHGHDAFLMSIGEARDLISKHPKYAAVLHPILIGNELTGRKDSLPARFVIDFHPMDVFGAQKFKELFDRIQSEVLPDREKAAKAEKKQNDEALKDNPKARVNHHHVNFLKRWWQLSWPRDDMKEAIAKLPRYIVCSRVTMRPIFEFVHQSIRPSDALSVFPLSDDYSFGILQSDIHWAWFIHRCSTQNGRPRYTSDTVFDSFPWPQSPTAVAVSEIAKAAADLRKLRNKIKKDSEISLREMYRLLELPGSSPLKEAHNRLNAAVRKAYGMPAKAEPLAFLLSLNGVVVAAEKARKAVNGPGIPPKVKKAGLVTADGLRFP